MSQKRKQRPWTPEARANHLAGCRKYQKESKEMEFFMLVAHVARELGVEFREFAAWMLTQKKEGFDRYVSIEPFETRKDRIRAAIRETMDRIGRGEIPDPIHGARERAATA